MQDIGYATTTFLTTYLEEASKRIEAEALTGRQAAEVKTGQRRIIEFFLAPLLRHGQESIRER